MDVDEMMDSFDLKSFPLFKGFFDHTLETILVCMCAEVEEYAAGEPIQFKNGSDAMILSGEVKAVASVNAEKLSAGTLFGPSFYNYSDGNAYFKEYYCISDTTLMVYDTTAANSPCWFSCFFHAALINNMNKINQEQNRRRGLPLPPKPEEI